ncbi:porin [Methylococcus sp. EFPC2]|uniref:porin n=1 Tax=Methylococcus sp. EFPC2 TaxID=2812648 RepID=UPI001967CDEF|nr:porin [Methylococcus sp. EFPC2]QSA98592.1 porin [Methylococcus sp. EFPC2]
MSRTVRQYFPLKPLLTTLTLASISTAHAASDLYEAKGLLELAGNPNESSFLKNLGLTVGGWINAGVTYNANDPGSKFNGPVTFGDRSSELQLNQLYLYVQRAVNAGGDSWDVGGRFDFMYGTDAVFTQAYGSPRGHWDLNLIKNGERFYDIALPQAYLEIYAPFGKGISAKIGHFYTIIGNEVVTAPDNFFYSHAYTMQYGEPFTHTGILLSTPLTDNFTLSGGAVTGSTTAGWDGAWDKGLGNWAFLGGVTWTSDDKGSSVALTSTSGEISEQDKNNWSLYSLVIKHDIIEGLHYTFQHDHGWANKVLGGTQDAEWYGINQYLTYDIQDNLGVGIRAEWFRDDDGFRVASPGRTLTAFPGANNYYAVTAGLNWKPLKWLAVRPNVRYDWSDNAGAFDNVGSAAAGYAGAKKDQFLFSTDVVVSF